MKKEICIVLSVFLLVTALSQPAGAFDRFKITHKEVESVKGILDDPAPLYTGLEHWKKLLPPDLWDALTSSSEEEMKAAWSEIVGFKAPDLVGKIAAEIKPGTYGLDDKEKLPFKELMPPYYYNKFNSPGANGKNLIGNFTSFEVVPTRQYYYEMCVSEATKENVGKTELDPDGYILPASYVSGFPFPQPSGEQKAWQIIYNYKKRYDEWDTAIDLDHAIGVDRGFRKDLDNWGTWVKVKLEGRVCQPPLGWYDDRAKKLGEEFLICYEPMAPRDEYGNVYITTGYNEPAKYPLFLVYVNALRRIRKMTASDSQDQSIGSDQTYDDTDGFIQQLRPDAYPYEINVIDEREFLVPAATFEGKPWLDSKSNYLAKDLQFERRPMWVLELKQLDRHYIYSKRIMYIDKELLALYLVENYDQKDRLYRTYAAQWGFLPQMGRLTKFYDIMLDYVDTHSTFNRIQTYPAPFITRDEISVKRLIKTR